ncbi:carboxypeptidase regulatory-like domain-containing protein [Edaphobacter flagellatus]|uniref:carboxypeptidase regulatory-like domain-containing protein n=1 Tax=Edaphobacter flagellatus TaxID=1933044 RepID=UPI0021B2FBF8|nr:carboxypeptidase regulatory-like domain-containing protein [Edaphobacter flagellatus]
MKKIFGLLLVLLSVSGLTLAQTNISGDVAGTVTDATGAVVSGATVTVTSIEKGSVNTVTTNAGGQYRVSLLSPGKYTVDVTAPNFTKVQQKITVSAGTVSAVDVKLTLGSQTTTVEVTADAQLLHTEDAQLTTNFSYEQVQSLPNPGNDLTFVAQTAPGSTMNTQGGYGNFSSFGLPATSNTFTVNGGYENDPFLNTNNSGATNLLLGNNNIETVTVVSPAFDASFGGLAGAQVAEISRSGSNAVHGNLMYQWNGSVMNANDWFNNNTGTKKPRSNANAWAAAIGGPIKRDKAFWFIDTEGLRVIIPVRATIVAPSAAWQNFILSATPQTDTCLDPVNDIGNATMPCFGQYGNLAANGNLSQASLYKTIFGYYNNAPGASNSVALKDPRFVQFNGQSTNFAQEWILAARVDLNLTSKDKLFVHYKQDKGVQPTNTNLLSPLFNANSPQPSYEGQANWTRSISPTISNQFVLVGSYYRAIFTNTNQTQASASVPFVLAPAGTGWGANTLGTTNVGGLNYDWPQGRNVTGYQVIDNLSITKGKHAISLGYSLRRDLVTDYTPSIRQVGESFIYDNGDFAAGYTDLWSQRFPQRKTQPLAVYAMGAYLQDQWKPLSNLTLTAGIRLEHNSNPICHTNCFSTLSSAFSALPTSTSTPYNQLFASGRYRAFLKQQNVGVNPRFGFAYLPNPKTTIRGGFGMFTEAFPAQIASDIDTNAPSVARFTIYGAAYGNPYTLSPSDPASAGVAAATSAKAFQSAYASGGSYKTILAATGGTFTRPAFQSTQPKVYLPTVEEWSLAVERQIDSKTVVSATYVGNHGYHGAVLNGGLNAFAAGFSGLPSARPNGSLGTVTYYTSNNQSNYNGVVLSANRRSGWLTVGLNYQYSHAFDLVSNGGFDAFGVNPVGQQDPYNVSRNYGSADYNVKHYISGQYIVDIPATRGPKILVGGWQVAGTVFHNSGLPFSVTDGNTVPSGYNGTLFANQLDNNFSHVCGGASHAGVNGTPCAFGATDSTGQNLIHFASASGFGQQRRNTFVGPAYTDTDMTITKSFNVPFREAKLKVGAQFFNLFNHPNFALPTFDAAAGAGTTGLIQSTVSTPTSILGSFLGGDASPRLIQLVGKFNF